MCEMWKTKALRDYQYDYYSDEKLEYMFLKTLQAMNYIHKSNMYYGDMKPANILVFNDYKLKLGDFGTVMKMTDDPAKDYYVTGYTEKYSLPKIR